MIQNKNESFMTLLVITTLGGIFMSKKSKSKRFSQQSSDAIQRYHEKIPYYSTLAEAEERQRKHDEQIDTSLGGI